MRFGRLKIKLRGINIIPKSFKGLNALIHPELFPVSKYEQTHLNTIQNTLSIAVNPYN